MERSNPEAYARLIDEVEGLGRRIEKLEAFDKDRVDRVQGQLLRAQLEVMRSYYDILQARISLWS